MRSTSNFVAVDLGASSGRVVVGRWDGERFTLEELHRFPNGGIAVGGSLYWDVLRLWSEIKTGLSKYSAAHDEAPAGISVDTWGVDFALLTRSGHLLGNPHHYRDSRTAGMPERAYSRMPRLGIFSKTGIQTLQINTLFQLFSMACSGDQRLESADALLMMPDLFHFWLCGDKSNEYTIASTTQMLDCHRRDWARDIAGQMGIPARLLGTVTSPCTVLSNVRPDVLRECDLAPFPVVAGASHDTASAVAAIPNLDENSVFISSGTWSLMGIESPEPVVSDKAMELGFTNEGGVEGTIRLLKNISGLWPLQECAREWQRKGRGVTWPEIVKLGSEAKPLRSLIDPDAPEFLAPESMPDAIRDFCRRSGEPEPQDEGAMARCCLESLSLKYRSVLEDLKRVTNREFKKISVVGGGSQNKLLCQFAADACKLPVTAGPVEASALGNVMVQAVASGMVDSISAGRACIAKSCELASYEPQNAGPWDEAYERFRNLRAVEAL